MQNCSLNQAKSFSIAKAGFASCRIKHFNNEDSLKASKSSRNLPADCYGLGIKCVVSSLQNRGCSLAGAGHFVLRENGKHAMS